MSSQSESIGPQRRLSGEERGAGNQQGKEFLALFSHELRNSLGAIRGATHVLRAGALGDSAQAKARALIERQVDQMTRLVEDLLDVSRIGNGQLRLQRDRIDVRTVLAHSVQAVELTMQQRNHRMTTSFPDAPVWLLADAVRLEQVFVNLLVNAARYTEAGGHVEVSVKQAANQAIICIRDTGVGIAVDLLPKVFDLYVQAHPSPRNGGLGLGLPLVRHLVESHGGRVTAASAGPRQGSEFTVYLPIIVQP